MKKINIPYIGLFLAVFLTIGCEYDGIDPITKVETVADAGAPEITISFPTEGATIKVVEPMTSVDIKFDVVDDLEIKSISVSMDGSEIATYSDFLDYRVVKKSLTYEEVTNGDHVLSITATDMEGNTSTKNVNFSKEPPYTPRFANEYFYMPFDGDYTELVTITNATQVGTPGFTDEAYLGSKAYKGAPESYITLPFDGSIGESFTVSFWYNVNAEPDRAGILTAGATADNRNNGFRLFREKAGDEQRIKLNVGTGAVEAWNDGGLLDPSLGEYAHIAVTVTPTETIFYINGVAVNTGTLPAPIDWTGVEKLTIGAGGETFSYWDHKYDSSPIDELRMFDAVLSPQEIQALIDASAETLYMPFNNDFKDVIANREVTVAGNPSFSAEAIEGSGAYKGAADSYLSFPAAGLKNDEFSASFWYKVNPENDRAGIITLSAEDLENAKYPDVQNLRTFGFRLFREGNDEKQRIKLNVGTGTADVWNDGGEIDATSGDWAFIAFTISNSETKIYIDGELVNTAALASPVDWTGADEVSVMSGAPRFTEWNHLSDTSLMDALRFYNKVLTAEEVQAAMAQ